MRIIVEILLGALFLKTRGNQKYLKNYETSPKLNIVKAQAIWTKTHGFNLKKANPGIGPI